MGWCVHNTPPPPLHPTPYLPQSVVRGRRARRLANEMRLANLRAWVVTRMQSRFRGKQRRRAYVIMMIKRNTEHEVATKIQVGRRIFLPKHTRLHVARTRVH